MIARLLLFVNRNLRRQIRRLSRRALPALSGLVAAVWSLVFHGSLVLGQQRPFQYLQREFRRRSAGEVTTGSQFKWILIGFLVGLIVLGIGVWLFDRFRHRRPYRSNLLLFLELCWVHRLRPKQIWQMWRWIRSATIRPAGRVFVEPELWEGRVDFVTRAAGTPATVGSWDALYLRCFGDLIPPQQTPTSPAEQIPAGCADRPSQVTGR